MAKTTANFKCEDEIPGKEERSKMWKELDDIAADLDSKRQALIAQFTMIGQGNAPVQVSESEVEDETKSAAPVTAPPPAKEEAKKVPDPIPPEAEESDQERKETLSALERRIKEVDSMRDTVSKKLQTYIDTIRTVKDDVGTPMLAEGGKIEELASIMMDHQRDAATSFSRMGLSTSSGVLAVSEAEYQSERAAPSNDPEIVPADCNPER